MPKTMIKFQRILLTVCVALFFGVAGMLNAGPVIYIGESADDFIIWNVDGLGSFQTISTSNISAEQNISSSSSSSAINKYSLVN